MPKRSNFFYFIKNFIIISSLVIPAFIVWAWNMPSSNPPSGNVPSPIDTSSTAQTKTGNLTIDGVFRVGRFSSAPTGATGSLYFDTSANKLKVYDNASWTDISGGGSGLSGSGAVGQVSFWTATSTLSGDNALFWDNTNKRLGIGTTTPSEKFEVVGKIKLDDETMETAAVTFDGDTSAGLKLTNPRGYITLTPLNTGWAHIYTDRSNFIFDKPVYSIANIFSSYNADLLLRRAGITKITAGESTVTIANTLTVNGSGNNYFAGNLGIGTTTPASLLTVGAGGQFQVNSSGDIIKLKNLTYSWPASHTANGYLRNDGSGNLTWSTVSGTIGGSGSANYLPKFTDATTLATSTIYELSGNVGIGTLTPGAKLDIENINAGVNEDLRLSYKNEVNSGGKISWWAQDVAETANIIHNLTESGGANGYLAFSTYNGGGTGLTEKLRITGLGNIGIATTTPSAKLHINNTSNDASLRITGTGYVDMPVGGINLSNSNIYNDITLLIPAIGHINSTRGQIGYFSRTDTSSGNTASYANDTGWWSRYDTTNNYPRIQRSLVGRGVWVENTRKNLFQYSSFEDGGSITGWTNSGLETFTTTTGYRKDASYSASLADTNASGGQAYRPHTLTNGQIYPFYCYAMNLTSGAQRQTVDSSVVQLWAGSAISTTYESQGDGWYKISGTVTGTGASVNYGVDVKANKAIALDACQIEANSSNNGVPYATTYIYNNSTYQRKRGEESWYYRAWRGAWDSTGSAYNIEPAKGTISFWFRPEWAASAQNQDAYFLEVPNAIRVFFQAADDKIYAQMYNGSNWTTVSVASAVQTWSANTDHFFSFRWDSSVGTTLNIDGVETSYSGSWAPQVAAITYDSYFYIGSKSTTGNRLDALISNLAVFNRSLSASEVAQIYYLKGPIWDINRSDLVTLQQTYTGYQRGNIRISGEFSGGTVSVSTLNATYASLPYSGLINSANYSSHIIFHLPLQNGLNGSRKEIGTFSRPDVTDGVATRWNESSMKLSDVNANTPRIDLGLIGNSYNYDSSNRPANYAVYVEESRKNVATYSSFEDGNPPTGWTTQSGCSAASATKAIHGSKSVNLISTAASRYYQTINFTGAPVKHQITAYVWRNEASAWGGSIDSSIVSLYAATNLTSGGLSTVYTPLSNGWYYLKAEFTATAADWNVGIYLPSGSRNIYVDAIQVERVANDGAAYFPTSYIPTSATAATRAAEKLSYSLPVSFKSEKGGFQLWFKPNWTRAISGDNTDKYIFYIPNVMRVRLDATNDRWAIEHYNGSTWILTANTTTDISPYIWNHLVCGWYYNYNYCRLNGNAYVSGTGWTPQDPSGQMIYIGSDPNGQNQINAEVAAFTLFDSYLDTSFQYQMYLNRGDFRDFFRTDQALLSDSNSPTYQEGSLSLTGVFRSGLGSAIAPAFSFLGATQTGMFAPATSSLAFTAGGNEVLRVNSSGNVGIGTSTPAVNLQIDNTGASARLRINTDSDKSSILELASAGTPVWHFERYPTDNSFRIVESGIDTRMAILPGGALGIATTTPASLLTVGAGGQFQVNSSGDIVKLKNLTYSWPSSHTANGYLRNDGSGNLTWETVSSGGTEHNLLSATHLDTLTGSPVLGDLIYANGTPKWTKLAGNTTATKKFLTQTGNGTISAAPLWDTLLASDLPSHSHSAADITAGTLTVARGGTGATTFTANGILYGNGTSALQVTAAGTNNYLLYSNNGTPAWTNSPTISGTNITSLNASNISAGTVPTARISGSYTSLTGVGTLTAGTWNATPITDTYIASANTWNAKMTNPMTTLGDIIYGGASGAPTRLAGSAGFLKSTGAAAPSWSALAASDIPNLDANKITSGTLPIARGGTGATTLTSNGVLLGNGTSAISAVAAPTGTYKVLSTLNGTTIGWNSLEVSHIPNLDASKIASGNLGIARMPTGGNWDIASDLTIESPTLFVGQASGSYAGNVGIGTTTPAVNLVVNKSGATSRVRINSDSSKSAMLELASAGTPIWHLEKYIDDTFRIVESGADARLTIIQGGQVGIGGPAVPQYALQVTGSINATDSLCINGDCKTSWPTGGGGGLPIGAIILGSTPDDQNLINAGCFPTGQTITTDQMTTLYFYQC